MSLLSSTIKILGTFLFCIYTIVLHKSKFMKSLKFQIIWKQTIFVLLTFLLNTFIILYFSDKNVVRISYILIPTLVIFIYLFHRRLYGKISSPLKVITQNSKESLTFNWSQLKKVETKIEELAELSKYSEYLVELLKEKSGAENSSKI